MVMPGLQVARSKSRSAICWSNLHQMGVAMEEYKADQSGFIPIRLVQSTEELPAEPSWPSWLMDSAYAQSTPSKIGDGFSFTQYCGDAGILKCPEMRGKAGSSYGRNQRIRVPYFRQVPRHDEFPLVLDSLMDRPRYYANAEYRHQNAANALYMDSHVARIDYNGLRIFSLEPLPGWPPNKGLLMPVAFHVTGTPMWESLTFWVLQDEFEVDSGTLLPGEPGSADDTIEFDPMLLDPIEYKVVLRVAIVYNSPHPNGTLVFHVRVFDEPWEMIGKFKGKTGETEVTFDITWYLEGLL
jgi:prepilin-type processing-associated H-X9-DG protein